MMQLKRSITSGLLLTSGLLFAASANAILIDDFATPQQSVTANPPPTPISSSNQSASPTALGGFRDLQATASSSPLFTDLTVSVDNGLLQVQGGNGVEGFGAITWDGDDTPDAVNTDGLGGVDFTDAGASNGFMLDILGIDEMVQVNLIVWDMDGTTGSVSINADDVVGTSFAFVNFSDFANVDFTNMGALQLNFFNNSPTPDQGMDVVLTLFETADVFNNPTPVPVPSTITLLGLGLLSLRLMRKKS